MIDVITEAILIAVLALVVAYFCYLAFIYFVDNIEDDTDMDFYDSMELSKLPIIKMHSNGQVITFLLDTGADCSFLDKQSAEKFITSPAGTTNPTTYKQKSGRGKTIDSFNPNKITNIINIYIDDIILDGAIISSRDKSKLRARQVDSNPYYISSIDEIL